MFRAKRTRKILYNSPFNLLILCQNSHSPVGNAGSMLSGHQNSSAVSGSYSDLTDTRDRGDVKQAFYNVMQRGG
jgi:hypothetical protein